MKLKNILIVVKDIERSRQFYHDLFGLDRIVDNDGNMILMDGLVLQDEKIWREFLGKEVIPRNNACELYFEENDVNRLTAHSWGQKMVRFYDLDGNLIEVRTPE